MLCGSLILIFHTIKFDNLSQEENQGIMNFLFFCSDHDENRRSSLPIRIWMVYNSVKNDIVHRFCTAHGL